MSLDTDTNKATRGENKDGSQNLKKYWSKNLLFDFLTLSIFFEAAKLRDFEKSRLRGAEGTEVLVFIAPQELYYRGERDRTRTGIYTCT